MSKGPTRRTSSGTRLLRATSRVPRSLLQVLASLGLSSWGIFQFASMLVPFVVVVGSTTLYLRWSRPSLIPAAGVDLGVDAYACCCRCAARGAATATTPPSHVGSHAADYGKEICLLWLQERGGGETSKQPSNALSICRRCLSRSACQRGWRLTDRHGEHACLRMSCKLTLPSGNCEDQL
jgi:hypothetical protein